MISACQKIAASFPAPQFYESCKEDLRIAQILFAEDRRVSKCRKYILDNLRENLGHGAEHAEKVSVEAGALVHREGATLSLQDDSRIEATILAEMAGLLHDLRRGEKDHSQAGAKAAGPILRDFFLTPEKENFILKAITNHEAFTEPQPVDSVLGQIISDALYDADKFRWGPDNFTVTLWRMLRFAQASIPRLISGFPKGMKGISRIRDTFRTATGRRYGPEFIDLGLQIGEEIYQFLQERFAEEIFEEERKWEKESRKKGEDG
jgi:hypothetical protein